MTDNVAKIMHNTVCVLAFIALAIYFHHWWIALFSLIFFMWPTDTYEIKLDNLEELMHMDDDDRNNQ